MKYEGADLFNLNKERAKFLHKQNSRVYWIDRKRMMHDVELVEDSYLSNMISFLDAYADSVGFTKVFKDELKHLRLEVKKRAIRKNSEAGTLLYK